MGALGIHLFRKIRAQAYLVLVLFVLVSFFSCSDYSKALKSPDPAYKLQVAEKYLAKENYERAIPLLEELIILKRGSADSERVNYLHAKCTYNMKDYTLAAYYLANFVRTFPNSTYAEECAFLSAYCQSLNSPNYELDQTDTRSAIDQMQLFLVRFPSSSLRDSCNNLIDVMRAKLEVKSYHGSLQYYKMRNYQAAKVSFDNFNREWPNSKYREEAMFYALKSQYNLAVNSVDYKKLERYEETITAYHNFADAFPQSVLLDEAKTIFAEAGSKTGGTVPTTTP